jgi:hypothetical protein
MVLKRCEVAERAVADVTFGKDRKMCVIISVGRVSKDIVGWMTGRTMLLNGEAPRAIAAIWSRPALGLNSFSSTFAYALLLIEWKRTLDYLKQYSEMLKF